MEIENKTSMQQYAEIATCMGITDCYLTKPKLGKIFWRILIIAGLIVTTFQVYGTFIEYLNGSPFKVTLSKEGVDNLEFPFITICNFNRAKQSVINETNLDPKVLIAIFQMFPSSYDIPLANIHSEPLSVYEEALSRYKQQLGNEFSVKNFFRKFGHNANESVLSFTFGNGYLVPTENFTEVFTTYGRCWRVNVNSSQPISGSFAGAKLMLNPQLNEYMTDVIINNFFQEGFAISLSFYDDPTMSEAIMLEPGSASTIQLKATRNTYPDTEFSIRTKPCRKNAKFKLLNADYTPQNCVMDCYMQAVLKKCGCILCIETVTANISLCNISRSMDCAVANSMDKLANINWSDRIGYEIKDCSKTCINPCENFTTIEMMVSTTRQRINNRLRAQKIIRSMGPNWSDDFIQDAVENSILANIHFSSSELNVVETAETPIMTFIGNIGGQLGLWMGISMFSIIQFVYYVFLGCVNGEFCCKRRKVKDFTTKTRAVSFQS